MAHSIKEFKINFIELGLLMSVKLLGHVLMISGIFLIMVLIVLLIFMEIY